MKLDELTDWARYIVDSTRDAYVEQRTLYIAHGILSLLTVEKPCMADPVDIVSVDSDGYVTVYPQHSMRGDEAHYAAVEILKAALTAKDKP